MNRKLEKGGGVPAWDFIQLFQLFRTVFRDKQKQICGSPPALPLPARCKPRFYNISAHAATPNLYIIAEQKKPITGTAGGRTSEGETPKQKMCPVALCWGERSGCWRPGCPILSGCPPHNTQWKVLSNRKPALTCPPPVTGASPASLPYSYHRLYRC